MNPKLVTNHRELDRRTLALETAKKIMNDPQFPYGIDMVKHMIIYFEEALTIWEKRKP